MVLNVVKVEGILRDFEKFSGILEGFKRLLLLFSIFEKFDFCKLVYT